MTMHLSGQFRFSGEPDIRLQPSSEDSFLHHQPLTHCLGHMHCSNQYMGMRNNPNVHHMTKTKIKTNTGATNPASALK